MEQLVQDNINVGLGVVTFGEDYLGRTTGETKFSYGIETQTFETEEDGEYEEVVTKDEATLTIPMLYTDIDSLAVVIPWATKVTNTTSSKSKLVVGKAIGTKLSQYAKKLVIHPESMGDSDLSKDVTIFKCYPKPGPIEFSYSRNGQRVANVTFKAIRDTSKPAGQDYFCIGDPAITAA